MNVFQGPKLKTCRAKKHIIELCDRISAFQKADFYTLSVDRQFKSGYDRLKLEITESLPDDISPIIGDATHNLRTALDLLINGIVSEKLGVGHRIYFPFGATMDDLKASKSAGVIKQASLPLYKFIIEEVKPYKAGNKALYSLNDLDIADKHKLLLPLIHGVHLTGVETSDDNGKSHTSNFYMCGPNPFFSTETRGNLHIHNRGNASIDIVFDKGVAPFGELVLPLLGEIIGKVRDIIHAVEQMNIC